ncbi:MAG TPA: Xaa-Pro peptidase family protein, partial [Ktedonobacteraceae bacterium]
MSLPYALSTPGVAKAPLLEQLRVAKLDGLLLTSAENVYYVSGLPTLSGSGNPILFALKNQLPTFVYLNANSSITLFCWIGATMGLAFPVDEVRSFFNQESALGELRDFLSTTLKDHARVGVESSCPISIARVLQEFLPADAITLNDDTLLALRLRKTEGEIALIRKATEIVEATTADLRAYLKPGLSRLHLINLAKRLMLEHGASGIGHTTIAFGVSNPEIAYDETLAANQLVTLDLGAVVEGYTSDNRRLFYTGIPPADLHALHQIMCELVEQVGQELKPGTAFADLYNLAGELYTERELLPFFLSIGHSLGLQTEEVWISSDSTRKVEAGMVLNIELYAPYQDGTSIGDEET